MEACLERGVLSIPVLYSARLLYSLAWMSACTLNLLSSGIVLSDGNFPRDLEPELCVCSSEKLGLDKLERGFVNKVLGNERSAELGCGTELISL